MAGDSPPLSDLVAAWEPRESGQSDPPSRVASDASAFRAPLDRRASRREDLLATQDFRRSALPATRSQHPDGPLDFSLHLDDPSRLPKSLATGPQNPTRSVGGPERRPRPAGPLAFPRLGEVVAGFRIVHELGRGTFARVYLAEQTALAHRRVALKISRPQGEEPQILAKLQHTHIVPIHSVHDDPQTGLRLLCMPYLGGANLAQVLDATGDRLPTQATGLSLITALDQVGGRLPLVEPSRRPRSARSRSVPPPPGPESLRQSPPTRTDRQPSAVRSRLGHYLARLPWWPHLVEEPPPSDLVDESDQPARRFLRSASYIQATVWIAARLAEALEHAHSRGLLHRDLKPSNILIAADGTPMLLDFNLSAELRADDCQSPAQVGGTLPYMAPEHLDAFDPGGSTPPEAVDERSDLYSLALILFEMLVGHPAFPDPPANLPVRDQIRRMMDDRLQGPPSARAANPSVPWSLDAILAKALDPRPSHRYQEAAEFAEDLRRFLDDLPLKFAPEPSLRERVAKWCRRHPRACSASSIGTLAAGLFVAFAAAGWTVSQNLDQARSQFRFKQFESEFREAQLLLSTHSGPERHLPRGIDLARKALQLYDVSLNPGWLAGPKLRWLTEAQRETLRGQTSELLLLLTRGLVRQTDASDAPDSQQRVLAASVRWLDHAEAIDPAPSRALYEQRAEYLTRLGRHAEAAADLQRAEAKPLTSARDYYLLGSALMAKGRPDDAEPYLFHATTLDPKNYWTWFTLGLCQSDRGRHQEAIGTFSACVALAPRFAWGHLNRGLELARVGRLREALHAYDQALAANPHFVTALLNRGLAWLELGEPTFAAADLRQAIRLGVREEAVLLASAEALDRSGQSDEAATILDDAIARRPEDPTARTVRGFFRIARDPDGARSDLNEALRLQPRHARAHLGLAHLHRETDPDTALNHLDQALATDPALHDARELRMLLRARRGDFRAVSDTEALVAVPTPRRLYNAACALALLARIDPDPQLRERALELLRRAVAYGFPKNLATADPDLNVLQQSPDFFEIVQ